MKQEKNTAGTLVITGGDTARTSRYVSQAEKAAVRAAQSAAAAEAAMLHPPIPGENGNWQIWDQQAGHYADSGESCRGAEGASAYEQAVAGGYSGTEASFIEELTGFSGKAAAAEQAAADAASAANTAVESSNHADHASRQAEMFEVSAKQSAARAEAGADEARSAQAAAESARNDVETAVESVTGSAAQIQSHKQDIDKLKSAKAPVIIDTASGAITSFEDGADGMPLKSLTVNIEPVQSGTGDPSPDNVRPISGWMECNVTRTGKNRLSKDGIFQGSITSDGTVNASDTTRCYSAFIKIEPGSTYTFSCETGIIVRAIHTYKRRSQAGSSWNGRILNATNSVAFTAGADDNYCRAMYSKADYSARITPTEITSPQMENGSTATIYEPYQGDTYPITFPTEAGTVYGGTLTINDDGSADLVDNVQTVTLNGSSNLNGSPDYDGTIGTSRYFYIPNTGVGNPPSVNLALSKCNKASASKAYIWASPNTNVWKFTINSNTQMHVCFDNAAVGITTDMNTDARTAAIKSWLANNPMTFVVQKRSSDWNTYHFDSIGQLYTYLGTNNIWADCGPVSVEYCADTKLYIQKINAPSDDDMPADTQIATGKYFIVGNNLYLSTTTIPAGDTIIPGTNCQQTNLAEALNALNT